MTRKGKAELISFDQVKQKLRRGLKDTSKIDNLPPLPTRRKVTQVGIQNCSATQDGDARRMEHKDSSVAADARTAITFALSPGHAHDAPEGRELLRDLPPMPPGMPLLMDRAYEGNETKQLVLQLGMVPIVPPKSNRVDPWRYDRNGAQEAQRDSGWPTIHALIWPLPHRLPITPTLRHHKILCEILCRLTDALSGDITRLGRSRLVEWCLPRCNIADHDRGLRWVVEDAE